MKSVLEQQENLDIKQTVIDSLVVEKGRITGAVTSLDETLILRAVVIATGTFLNGLIHIGLKNFPAGRMGDPPSTRLSEWFRQTGFLLGRMKTGTPPRLDSRTIDFTELEAQYGDDPPNSSGVPLTAPQCIPVLLKGLGPDIALPLKTR